MTSYRYPPRGVQFRKAAVALKVTAIFLCYLAPIMACWGPEWKNRMQRIARRHAECGKAIVGWKASAGARRDIEAQAAQLDRHLEKCRTMDKTETPRMMGAFVVAIEAERIQRGLASDDERLSLGELTALYFQSRPEFNRETKKKIIYFLAGYQKNGKHREGAGEFLRDKYAESLNRQDLERMRNNLRLSGANSTQRSLYHVASRAYSHLLPCRSSPFRPSGHNLP